MFGRCRPASNLLDGWPPVGPFDLSQPTFERGWRIGDQASDRRRGPGFRGEGGETPLAYLPIRQLSKGKRWKVDVGRAYRVPGHIERSTSTLRMQIGPLSHHR